MYLSKRLIGKIGRFPFDQIFWREISGALPEHLQFLPLKIENSRLTLTVPHFCWLGIIQ